MSANNIVFQEPKKQGKFKTIESGNEMTTETIIDRIIKNAMQYKMRNLKKEKKEMALLKSQEKLEAATKVNKN